MIGQEWPGEQSEVAQLIQQALEQERRQWEMMELTCIQYGEDKEETGKYAAAEELRLGTRCCWILRALTGEKGEKASMIQTRSSHPLSLGSH